MLRSLSLSRCSLNLHKRSFVINYLFKYERVFTYVYVLPVVICLDMRLLCANKVYLLTYLLGLKASNSSPAHVRERSPTLGCSSGSLKILLSLPTTYSTAALIQLRFYAFGITLTHHMSRTPNGEPQKIQITKH